METVSTKNIYASRKRRKPVLKCVKQPSVDGVKSNPSKRHRDKLNGELDRLASLLPFHQDVITKLDKLTVLRLSVGYLRARSHFSEVQKLQKFYKPANNELKTTVHELPEGELLLQVINGFVLVVTSNGTVFYASSTVQDYLGFQQSDIIHQSVYEFIHTEDRTEFQRQLHWALNPSTSTDTDQLVQATKDTQFPVTYCNPEQLPPENSAFLERNFICRLRCLLNNSSGFLAINFQGRLKFLHGQNERTAEGKLVPPQLALFALACPLQPPCILEIRAKTFIFKTKHKLDFTPTDCDAKGKIVLGYTEAELCYRGSGYQFIHAADMLYCAENHIRMMKTGESGLTVFRLLTKLSGWVWVQANARLIYKNGQPEFIIASQRVLTDEEGEETLKKRSIMLPFSFTTGEAVLYDMGLSSSLSGNTLGSDCIAPRDSNQAKIPSQLDPNSLLGSMLKQDESIYVSRAGMDKQQRAQDAKQEDDGLGEILSSTWQKSLLSLSERPLFNLEPPQSSEEKESTGELLSFMGTLGITTEDLQLLQQDELFLNLNGDGKCRVKDFKDEVLSYIEESLRMNVDFSNNLEEKCLLDSAPLLEPPPLFSSHTQVTSQFQQQHQSALVEHSDSKMEPFAPIQCCLHSEQSPYMQEEQLNLQSQPQLDKEPSLTQLHKLSSVIPNGEKSVTMQPGSRYNPQQRSPFLVNSKHVHHHEQSWFSHPQEQPCHNLNSTQVNGAGFVVDIDSSEKQLPDVLQCELQEPGCFYLETTPLALGMSYRNPINHCMELPCSYITTEDSSVGAFPPQYFEELLTCLDSVGQEKHIESEELQAQGPLCGLDQRLHVNGVYGNLQGNFDVEVNKQLPAQPHQQHPSDGRPYINLPMEEYLGT